MIQQVRLLSALALIAPLASAQFGIGGKPQGGPSGLAPGTSVQDMWPAPTSADWAKPTLIQFQRTWDDAFAVSRETKKPILVCVNMDGEPASEHYAGVEYRDPKVAALFEPYVCVVASVYRHTPRDHDEFGHRILCPRFGSVTCGEHIAIEPGLFEKYMEDRRVAPRHIMLELDGHKEYDVFFTWDVKTVLDTLHAGIVQRKIEVRDIVRNDMPVLERVAERDLSDRIAVEEAYQSGTRDERRKLLRGALAHPEVEQAEMLRLALASPDQELVRLARQALATSSNERSADLIAEALRVPMDKDEREMLIGALERIGATVPRVQTLAIVQRGMARPSDAIDLEGWQRALDHASGEQQAAVDSYVLQVRLDADDRLTSRDPADAVHKAEYASAALSLAQQTKGSPRYVRVLLADARASALEAEQLGEKGWNVESTLALAAARAGDTDEAQRRAEIAVRELPAQPDGPDAFEVVTLFVTAREKAIADAVKAKQPWPPGWVSDLYAAYSVLARHPEGTDVQIAQHYDYLRWLHANGPAAEVLEDGLARFPDSALLHDRLRGKVLADFGASGLEPEYATRLADPNAHPSLEWFAGYASIVAAEFHRRSREPDAALEAYTRAITHYERALQRDPTQTETVAHFIALALAGRARVELERSELDRALDAILASFARRAQAAATMDGLNLSPVDTAKLLLARFADAGDCASADRLEAALARLDPRLLAPAEYEREPPRRGQGRPPASGAPR